MSAVFDIAVVGGGIAGASLAAELAPHASVVLLESEDVAGYHSTGRSAAFWSETYGGPGVQPLTTASGATLRDGGFLQPLGSLHIGRAEDAGSVEAFLKAFESSDVTLTRVDPGSLIPGLRAEWTLGVMEPSCAFIDVAGLHAERLSVARRAGAMVRTSAGVESADRENGRWKITTRTGVIGATILVNATGAWADALAERAGVRPLGITSYRRTIAQIRIATGVPADLPHVADIAGRFYFKPEPGGRLWLSPHDETPTEPCDAAPEEMDVAIAVDRFENVVDWPVAAVERKWAGLRSFAADRLPVYGCDPDQPGFFWCAGQGGFGIQTAPAAARLCAALIIGGAMPDGLDDGLYRPDRLR